MYCRLALHFVSLTKAFEERRPPTIQIRFGFGSGSDLESISGLLKVNGDFPVQRYIYDKNFYKHMISFFYRYELNCEKRPYLTMLKNPFKNF